MIKKILSCTLCAVFLFMLSGCWSYIGLDEISMVSGVSIDKNEQTNQYKLAFEIIDLSSTSKEEGPSTKIIEAEGLTMFDAIRNANKKLANRLYFGHAQVIVLGESVVTNDDLINLMDLLIRDKELRENIYVVISQEKTANEILKVQGTDESNVSLEINEIVADDCKFTSTTSPLKLYKIYNVLNYPGICATLPAFHTIENTGEKDNEKKSESDSKSEAGSNENKINELNGTAVFKNQRLVGYLTPEESKYFLFVIDGVNGGILPMASSKNNNIDTSLEIIENKTKLTFKNKNGQVKIKVETKTEVTIGELRNAAVHLNKEDIERIETKASEQLKSEIEKLIKKVQDEYDSDIFGFGNLIYKKDSKLWNKISDQWEQLFPQLEIEVDSKVEIKNTALKKI